MANEQKTNANLNLVHTLELISPRNYNIIVFYTPLSPGMDGHQTATLVFCRMESHFPQSIRETLRLHLRS